MHDPRAGIGRHFTGDVREFWRLWKSAAHSMALEAQAIGAFDLAICHPTCTRLTNAGVRWLHERNLWTEMEAGAEFFNTFKGCAPRVAIENPVMHRYARALCGPFTQSVQPWQFGDPQFKRICLWLENLPPLVDTNRLTPPRPGTAEHKAWSKVHRAPPGPDRWRERSRFFPGVAAAMAEQWGALT
jgi:hypothetical protein